MKMAKLSAEQRYLRRRILEISYGRNLSHLGSCLSAVDVIHAIYKTKKNNEKFILSNGHAGIALYVVLEKYGLLSRSRMNDLSIHPDRDPAIGIDVSSGSLGQGLPIAVGMALADRESDVYCLISDGECAEGSIWEALRIGIEQKLENLKIVVNANGWGAYSSVDLSLLLKRIRGFGYKARIADGHNIKTLCRLLALRPNGQPPLIFAKTIVGHFPFLRGLDAHYYVMNEEDHRLAEDILK